MKNFLIDPAFWASLAALLAALGVVELEAQLWQHIIEVVAGVVAIVGMFMAWRDDKSE